MNSVPLVSGVHQGENIDFKRNDEMEQLLWFRRLGNTQMTFRSQQLHKYVCWGDCQKIKKTFFFNFILFLNFT